MIGKSRIAVKVADGRWKTAVPDLLNITRSAAAAAWEDEPEAEISVVLAADAAVADLNKRWRGKDGPTNVLSFPSDDADLAGDVIVAYETVAREASEQNIPVARHLARMLVHGVMHLRGYDHVEDSEAAAMEAKEDKINKALCERLGL